MIFIHGIEGQLFKWGLSIIRESETWNSMTSSGIGKWPSMGGGWKVWGNVEEVSLEMSMETKWKSHEYIPRQYFPEHSPGIRTKEDAYNSLMLTQELSWCLLQQNYHFRISGRETGNMHLKSVSLMNLLNINIESWQQGVRIWSKTGANYVLYYGKIVLSEAWKVRE